LIFFVGPVGYGQIESAVLNYQIDMDRFVQEAVLKYGETSNKLSMIKKTAEIGSEVEVELVFKDGKSVFRTKKGLSLAPEMFYEFVKTLISKGEYFTDLGDSLQLLKTTFEHKDYYVKSPIKKIEWELQKESKKIGEFTCYKAVYLKNMVGQEREIIAWYTPEIPLPLGPKEYVGGLPGIILELDEPIALFRCTSVTINPKKNIQIAWPDDTVETITEEAYDKAGDHIYQKIKSGGN